MSTQNFDNHAHRPLPTLLGAVAWVVVAIGATAILRGEHWGPPVAWGGVIVCLALLLSMGRLYTTKLQDRIILLEERLRVAALLTPAQLARWRELTPKQVAALRFAGDAELPGLLERTVADGLGPTAIKRAVKDWRADPHRT
jgi:hypothetical protein